MLKNVADISSQGKRTGLNTQDNLLDLDKSQSPDMMNVKVFYDGSIQKRFGSNTQNAVIIANSSTAGFSPAGTLTQNLVAYWKLDEAAGNRLDTIGGNTLTDNNTVLQSGGIRNQAALFTAANSEYLLINNTSTLATGDVNFSISTWFYLNSTSTTVEQTIISKRDLEDTIDSNTKLLIHFNGADTSTTFTDVSASAHTMTASGNAQIDTGQSKFGGGSLQCDGTNDWARAAGTTTDFDLGSGDFTIDCWLMLNTSGLRQNLWGQDLNAGNNRFNFCVLDNGKLFSQAENIGANGWNFTGTGTLGTGQFYHIAHVRSSNTLMYFINGLLDASSGGALSLPDQGGFTWFTAIGSEYRGANGLNGWIDEFRISRTARWNSNFTPPAKEYGVASDYEYWLFVNTDNVVTFKVSSSGQAAEGTVSATSFGAVGTATWYNAIAYHDTADLIAVGINLSMNSSAYASGVRSGSAPFVIGAVSNGAGKFFDGRIDETGFYKRLLTTTDRSNIYNSGSGNTYGSSFDNKPWASFDFGASSIRWLMVAAGTGVYASSNLGLTWVNVATDRTATYQYFERSKNVLIATSDSYDNPLFWSGSANTFMAIVNSNAPLARYSVNFNGFLIFLNTQARKRGIIYNDENTQLTGTYASSFDLPSSYDDEITASFILRRYLYISTRYSIFRLSYVGGNPDFSAIKIKDWGYVSRTVKPIYVEGVGQIFKGLCWDGKTRLFDGSEDQISSNDIEQDNRQCEFSLDNLSYNGSGLIVSFAETDYNENTYKLCVAIGSNSSQTTHLINYDGRSKAYYPYNRQHFNTMVMAESGGKRFLMAFDRSGYCHMMDSGNLDGNTTAIDDHFDSNYIYDKSPIQSQKGHQTHLFLSNETCGRLFYFDRTDFGNQYQLRETFVISGSENLHQIHKVIDSPESYNVYQWRLSSSSGTSSPWKLQRDDHLSAGKGIGKVE